MKSGEKKERDGIGSVNLPFLSVWKISMNWENREWEKLLSERERDTIVLFQCRSLWSSIVHQEFEEGTWRDRTRTRKRKENRREKKREYGEEEEPKQRTFGLKGRRASCRDIGWGKLVESRCSIRSWCGFTFISRTRKRENEKRGREHIHPWKETREERRESVWESVTIMLCEWICFLRWFKRRKFLSFSLSWSSKRKGREDQSRKKIALQNSLIIFLSLFLPHQYFLLHTHHVSRSSMLACV